MYDLSVLERHVGALFFKNPVIIGAGTCKTLADVRKAITTDAGGIEVGSISLHPKSGNSGKVFYAHYVEGVLMYTINSLGLVNPGKDHVSVWAKEAISSAHDAGMKIGMNVVGDTSPEIVGMVLWAINLGFDWVTINGGCPNKFDTDGKPIGVLGSDENQIAELLSLLEKQASGTRCEIWWKPPPYSDTVGKLKRTASLIATSKVITGYVANNTVAHCFRWGEDGKPVIDPGGGLGGMGGPAVKPVAEGHLVMLKDILPASMHRFASGGVQYGADAADFLRHRARLVQVTSAIWANNMNYGEANRILAELMGVPDLPQLMAM